MSDLPQRTKDALSDRCRIERPLGRSGMAGVLLAEDLKHRRRVAIKVMEPKIAAAIDPERLLREIETAARLRGSWAFAIRRVSGCNDPGGGGS